MLNLVTIHLKLKFGGNIEKINKHLQMKSIDEVWVIKLKIELELNIHLVKNVFS